MWLILSHILAIWNFWNFWWRHDHTLKNCPSPLSRMLGTEIFGISTQKIVSVPIFVLIGPFWKKSWKNGCLEKFQAENPKSAQNWKRTGLGGSRDHLGGSRDQWLAPLAQWGGQVPTNLKTIPVTTTETYHVYSEPHKISKNMFYSYDVTRFADVSSIVYDKHFFFNKQPVNKQPVLRFFKNNNRIQ